MHVNVPVSDAEKKRIEHQEEFWGAKRMLPLFVAFLSICLVILYCMSNLKEWLGTYHP